MKMRLFAAVFAGLLLTPSLASARVTGPIGEFIDFEGPDAPVGTPVNGLEIGGVSFSYGFPANRGTTAGAFVGFFPVNTPHTDGKGVAGSTAGLLGLTFARPVRSLSFGFALEGSQFVGDGSVRMGVIVDLFDPEGGFIGSFSQDAEPVFVDERGGGAEYASARFATGGMRIGSANVMFAQDQIPIPEPDRSFSPIDNFFFDNLAVEFAVIPLPSPALLGGAGLLGLASIRRRRAL